VKKPNRNPFIAVILWALAAGVLYVAFKNHNHTASFVLGIVGGILIASAPVFSGWTIG
jgi:hypothetical protein